MTAQSPALLFTGGSGLLGGAFRRLRPFGLFPSSAEFDVTSYEQMRAWIGGKSLGALVHAAAFTSPPKVDQDPLKALRVNVVGTGNVVRLCMELNLRLIYISTDYVFRGDRGRYREDDDLYPVNKYAWSKLGGECAVRLYDKALIVRTSFGPDDFPYPKAFEDQWTSRQSVTATARDILRAVESPLTGVIHVGGPRQTVLDYARALSPGKRIEPLSIKDVPFSVPIDTSLDTARFAREIRD
jgi:dTDP-4-dehydrorhamnose reductase